MTRRESRGLLVLIITLIALISGGIIAYKNPDSWHGLAMLVIGLIGCYLCYKRWNIATKATTAGRPWVTSPTITAMASAISGQRHTLSSRVPANKWCVWICTAGLLEPGRDSTMPRRWSGGVSPRMS